MAAFKDKNSPNWIRTRYLFGSKLSTGRCWWRRAHQRGNMGTCVLILNSLQKDNWVCTSILRSVVFPNPGPGYPLSPAYIYWTTLNTRIAPNAVSPLACVFSLLSSRTNPFLIRVVLLIPCPPYSGRQMTSIFQPTIAGTMYVVYVIFSSSELNISFSLLFLNLAPSLTGSNPKVKNVKP